MSRVPLSACSSLVRRPPRQTAAKHSRSDRTSFKGYLALAVDADELGVEVNGISQELIALVLLRDPDRTNAMRREVLRDDEVEEYSAADAVGPVRESTSSRIHWERSRRSSAS